MLLPEPRLAQQPREVLLEACLVRGGRLVRRVRAIRHLGHGVEKTAAAVALGGDVACERVEHGERSIPGVRRQPCHLRLEPRANLLVAPLDAGDDEPLFGVEVAIKTHPCDVGLRDDRVHADGLHALPIEQLSGHFQDPLAHLAHGFVPPWPE